LAWLSVLPPCLAITAAALFASVATRSSIAAVGVPVVVALLLQLVGLVDLPAPLRVAVPTTALEAWHGLLTDPAFVAPLAYGAAVNLGCAGACYTATLTASAEAQLGGPTMTAQDGRQIRNLLYAFDGCFDPFERGRR